MEEWKLLQARAKPSRSQTAFQAVWMSGQNKALWGCDGGALLNGESEHDQSWKREDKEGGEVANWGEKSNRRQNYKVTESRIRKGLEARRIEDDLQKR